MGVWEEKIAVGIGAGIGAALVGWWIWRRSSTPLLPESWEEVGEVSELIIYPLKSARGIRQKEAQAGIYGLCVDHLEDRAFMVLNAEGSFVSGRQADRLAAVVTEWQGQTLTLKFPGHENVSVDTQNGLRDKPVLEAKLRTHRLPGIDCGNEVSVWLSKVLYDDKEKVRLIYKGDMVKDRPARRPEVKHEFTQYTDRDRALYTDVSSYHLACQSSLDDLNSRLDEPVIMENFRPNIVVSGSKAYDEDDWVYAKIGGVILRRLKPCERCILTTVDPIKGKRNENMEPLATLKTYRMLKDAPPELATAWKSKPIFGITMSIDDTGRIAVGDKVYIARASVYPQFRGY
ncbi:mitochondrial amidoxime-reducing component 1-like [Macrobrachium rosenbergii]|uniref:mitochondrial amidoxime-reducing component 1-like n=1 Tax=Macrobrachium rosenbergii TaxID=79674 RepID=UPI0034D3F950